MSYGMTASADGVGKRISSASKSIWRNPKMMGAIDEAKQDALDEAWDKALCEVERIVDEMLAAPLRHKKDHVTGAYARGYINALRVLKANIDTVKR
jgi:hypothetical protein